MRAGEPVKSRAGRVAALIALLASILLLPATASAATDLPLTINTDGLAGCGSTYVDLTVNNPNDVFKAVTVELSIDDSAHTVTPTDGVQAKSTMTYRLAIQEGHVYSIAFVDYLAPSPGVPYPQPHEFFHGSFRAFPCGPSNPPSTPACMVSPIGEKCSTSAFVERQFRDWLKRAPTSSESVYWVGHISTTTNMSPQPFGEFTARSMSLLNFLRTGDLANNSQAGMVAGPVARLYFGTFLRAPEFDGFNYWLNAAAASRTMLSIAEFFVASPEFAARYGSLTNPQFVTLLYRNVFDRPPDQGGFDFWVGQLAKGMTRGNLMHLVTEAPEFQQRTRVAVLATDIYTRNLKRVPTAAEITQLQQMTPATADTIYNLLLNKS